MLMTKKDIMKAGAGALQPGRLMLVTEYLEGGDLFTALERDMANPKKFSWWKHPVKAGEDRKVLGLSRRVALDVARGLAFLHHRKVRCLICHSALMLSVTMACCVAAGGAKMS